MGHVHVRGQVANPFRSMFLDLSAPFIPLTPLANDTRLWTTFPYLAEPW